MTTVVEMLERLAKARGRSQLAEVLSGYQTKFRNDNEMMRSIRNIEEIARSGRRRNVIGKKGMRWR